MSKNLCYDSDSTYIKLINKFWGKLHHYWASLVAEMVKNLPAMQETQV